MNKEIKLLIFLFFVAVQLSLIIFFITASEIPYLTFYRAKNIFESVKPQDNSFPDFVVYTNERSVNILNLLSKNEVTMLAVHGCDCKDKELTKWIAESNELGIPFIYLYVSEKDFQQDDFAKKNKKVSVYKCGTFDIISNFKKDIVDFPVLYTVNREGEIIATER